MNWFSKFCPGDTSLLLTANVLVQIAVVVVLAAAISLLCGRHRPAVRHAIWLAALVCVLLSPAAAYLTAKADWSLVSLRLLPRSTASDLEAIPVIPVVAGKEQLPEAPQSHVLSPDQRRASQEPDRFSECGDSSPLSVKWSQSPAIVAVKEESGHESPHSKTEAMLGVAIALWMVGAIALFIRLLHGCWHIARLRRRLQPIDGDLAILADVRRILNAKALPPLAMLPQTTPLAGPITVGFFRPLVILPEEILTSLDRHSLRDILVHEFAHALRHDPLVGFVQRLAAIVYWPYPPVHFLNRRLALAREEVCDNYVLREGDAPSYAETLLAISQKFFSKRPRPAALGLFHPYGRLEQRVAELLNPRRNVMVRTHRAALALLALLFVVATVAAAGTRLIRAEPPPTKTAPPLAIKAETAAKSTPTVARQAKDGGETAVASLNVIEPGDVLSIRAVGTLQNHPIDGLYLVGPDGKVNLRPPYGTADVSRLSIEQAENTIAEHLKKIVAEDSIEVRYAIAAAAVAKADYEQALEANKRVRGTVPQSEVRKRLLESKKMELAVEKARKESTPVVQVTLARKAAGPWAKADLLAPYKIGVWDVLNVRVVGTLTDQPIDGYYLVEDTGTLALGPSYGRVFVKGMTIEAAEKAIEKKLREVLQKPQVQVTLAHVAERRELRHETAPPKQNAEPEMQTRSISTPPSTAKPPKRQTEPGFPILAPGESSDASLNIVKPLDILQIRAVGTLMNQPIDGFYLVEPDGQVALGPAYGRAKIAGLTLEKAEFRIMEQLKRVLAKPAVQVTLAMRGARRWRQAVLPKPPYKIGTWDILQVRAIGTLIDQPIDEYYLVEAEGTLALGPTYGRVAVKGLTVEEAEKAIRTKLREVLQKPEVQVTLARQHKQTEQWRNVPPPKISYTISPGDLLSIHATGTLLDQPIDAALTVEATGTIALGPACGRVLVKGMTFAAAEKAIRNKLREILQNPEVQVTFGGWRNDTGSPLAWQIGENPK
jgi:protein involved in polysaccharide export with SLBB domain/beta-lactamase regulating signal transducer with metallopeptidase domain